MGRGDGEHQLGSEAGEIRALDADRLDDHRGVSVEMGASESEYGDADDTRAVRRLISTLSHTKTGASLSAEDLEDRAIELYQGLLKKMERGCPIAEQEKIARALGEPLSELRERLGLDQPAPEAGSGESALLAQLRSAL